MRQAWLRAFVVSIALALGQNASAAPAATAAANLTAQAVETDRLPTPEGLESDVKFWEAVFSKYKPDQCVLHDKDDLSIVYAVKRLPGATPAAQARAQRLVLAALRAAILHLADGGQPRNLIERRIVAVTPEEFRNDPDYYKDAAENVRCQRGVDLVSSLERSRPHLKLIKKVLRQRNLPADLAYLPHLESGFQTMVRSKAGARGLWQLMPGTAREFGLRVSRKIDNRIDVALSTSAAAQMLQGFFEKTGNWPLAITAYNYGVNGMVRAIDTWGKDYMTIREKHRTRIFGFASRNYYPSFLAARNVASAYEKGLAVQ
jgi:membrane-bound lytic murein transglycosylase D